MCDFPVDLLVKQTVRSVIFDPATMGTLSSKMQHFHANANGPAFRALPSETAFYNVLKCPETVKYLSEHPSDYIHKIFENDVYKQSLALAKTDNELKEIKNQILYKFIKELKECRTESAVEWAAFQHYMLYVYRKFITSNPTSCKEPIPSVLMKKFYEHSMSLSHEDKLQFFIRLVMLLREYVTVARENYENLNTKGDSLMYIQSLLNYYNSFCSAATRIMSLFVHFDEFLIQHFDMRWFRLHQKLFFKYFYAAKSVKAKIAFVNEQNEINVPENLIIGFRNFVQDMVMTDRIWERQLKKYKNNTNGMIDEKLEKEIRRIMKTNFWISRTLNNYNKDHNSQQCPELVPFFPVVMDDTKNLADRLIRTDGVCICEDCMFAKFDHNVMNNMTQNDSDHIVLCYLCNESVYLDNLGTHLIQEFEEIERIETNKMFKLQTGSPSMKKSLIKKPSSKLCKILSDTVVKKDTNLFKINEDCFSLKSENSLLKEPISKRLLECPVRGESESIVRLANDYGKCAKTSSPDRLLLKHKVEKESIKIGTPFNENGAKTVIKSTLEKKSDEKNGIKDKDGYNLKFNVNNLPQRNFLGNSNKSSSLNSTSNKLSNDGCVGHACGHKCKKEDSTANGDTTDSTRDKKCDCAYCEVFGTNVPTHAHKTSETRDRLRNRLTRRKERINEVLKNKSSSIPTSSQAASTNGKLESGGKSTSSSSSSLVPNKSNESIPQPVLKQEIEGKNIEKSMKDKDKNDDDLDRILDFIQGKPVDKVALAEKKAAKKARQKQKKEEERLKRETEEEQKRLEEQRRLEMKRKEEEKLKALATKQQNSNHSKKNKKNNKNSKNKIDEQKHQKQQIKQELMEETIPAMVTIKRVVENNSSLPTVTITLKGSTPDQDKLLYTLVNGHASDYSNGKGDKKKDKKKQEQLKSDKMKNEKIKIETQPKSKNKKNKNNNNIGKSESNNIINGNITTKELKVTLTVDKSFHKGKEIIENNINNTNNGSNSKKNKNAKEMKKESIKTNISQIKAENPVEIDIPSLKLPPGITITKVSGPLTNKNNSNSSSSSSTSSTNSYQNVPVNKSGVIVVDTEKLIQQSSTSNPSKKSKKKKKKNIAEENKLKTGDAKGNMVTLRNPIFHTLQTKLVDKVDPIISCNEQASITKGENGMVTIRRPNYMSPIDYGKETPISEYLGKLKPVMNYELPPNKKDIDLKKNPTIDCNGIKSENRSRLSTHDILWGLPGIEITKVNKNAVNNDDSKKNSCHQAADVSIIPTSSNNNGEKFNLDRDDWPFESVFAPKDILEDDLDADERELEAFKRFCQQSIPPKHKEKVAHLNVKDIVLKKKNDVTYS